MPEAPTQFSALQPGAVSELAPTFTFPTVASIDTGVTSPSETRWIAFEPQVRLTRNSTFSPDSAPTPPSPLCVVLRASGQTG